MPFRRLSQAKKPRTPIWPRKRGGSRTMTQAPSELSEDEQRAAIRKNAFIALSGRRAVAVISKLLRRIFARALRHTNKGAATEGTA